MTMREREELPRAVGEISVKDLIVEITSTDFPRSRKWYAKLFGKKGPDLKPFPGNVLFSTNIVFKVGSSGSQISRGNVQLSSNWALQLNVTDLSREREGLRQSGIATSEIRIVPDEVSFFALKDPDGNHLEWFQVLTPSAMITDARN